MQDYFQELLTTGKLTTVIRLLKKEPEVIKPFTTYDRE